MIDLGKLSSLDPKEKELLFSKCCGSKEWIAGMMALKTVKTKKEILDEAEKIWFSLNHKDWLEAFSHHPKIGDLNSIREKFASTKKMAESEQSGVNVADNETLNELAKLNQAYERKFGYIFIVCATGKSAMEMLAIIKNRVSNDSEIEIKIAMKEQNKITKLRLEKLL
ncbi:MAG: 2-oxo-4-hydroxy-4-carboxy-5-ureidoimidazoline decarboxylase [bacterium]